jgi:hypothetical protein
VTREPLPEELEKWRKIERAADTDFQSPLMQFLGNCLLKLCNGDQRRVAELAMAMARDCIAYQSDLQRVGHEDLDHPQNIWRRGVDDCDGKSRLFVALVKAADGIAKPVPKWADDEKQPGKLWLQHVSAEVCLGGHWLPVELTLKRARVGEKPGEVPKELTDGKWLR